MVLALYQKYRDEGETFIPRYMEMLASGGSVRPDELVRPMGIDLKKPDFWAQGYNTVRELIEELKALKP